MKGKIDKLDKKLIRSPDRLQAKIEQKEKVLQNKRNLKKKLERQQFLLFSSMNELKESSKSLKPSLETFKEGVKELEKIRNQIKLLDETKAEINNNDKKLKALKIQLREHEKTIRTMRRKIVINEKQHEKQIETMKQINNGIKRELEAMQKNQSDQLQRSLEDKIKLEKRLDSLESEHQKFKNASQMYYRQHLASLQMIKTLINTRLNEFQNLKGVKKNFLI
jgi:chromosome segregation ATPase